MLAAVDNRRLGMLCARRRAMGETGWLPSLLADALASAIASADPGERPFRHPADWGAFTYLGS